MKQSNVIKGTLAVVALVAARNEAAVRGRISGNARIIGLAEWWCGPTPAHEIRFDGTFYPPRAAASERAVIRESMRPR